LIEEGFLIGLCLLVLKCLVLVEQEEHLEHLVRVWLGLNQVNDVDAEISKAFVNDLVDLGVVELFLVKVLSYL
jgi:DNA-directed RNA polymerase subunit F